MGTFQMRINDEQIYPRWEQVKDDVIPKNAISGGHYPTGEEVFLGRGKVRQNRYEYVPGDILPSIKMLVVAYGTGTKFLQDYEVLVSDHQEYLHWRKASSGLPLRPVTGGCDSKGEEITDLSSDFSSDNAVRKSLIRIRTVLSWTNMYSVERRADM